MKCHKCGCENEDGYNFCKNCGTPPLDKMNKSDSTSRIDPISGPSVGGGKFNRKTLLIGIGIIVIVAIVAIAVNSLNFGVTSGDEAIININENSFNSSGKTVYGISFTLTNVAENANTYYAKVTWYDAAGEEILSRSESLDYATIDSDNTMDVYVQASSSNVLNISECVIEVTDNQGELVTSTSHKWMNY